MRIWRFFIFEPTDNTCGVIPFTVVIGATMTKQMLDVKRYEYYGRKTVKDYLY